MSADRAPSSSSAANTSEYYPGAAPYFPVPFHLQKADPASTSQPMGLEQQYLAPPQLQQYSNPYLPTPQVPPPPVKMPGAAPVYPAAYSAAAPAVPGVYSLPQYQQAQQLFQRDAQTITPEALESVKAALASSEVDHKAETKKKAIPRKAAGQTWEDPTLSDWPESMSPYIIAYHIFLFEIREYHASFVFWTLVPWKLGVPLVSEALVVRDKRTGKTRGYGFVSFTNPSDLAAALKEMNGKYVGNRPIKLRKSTWKERTDAEALERQKNHSQKKMKQPRKGILHK
ncbi:hypothetical protein Taro_037897 [Colocasia esculenta]|uniref:RRM domain-containing protein n=1 Tax=Colocasia esculenta TaxID=4460 RepID=A0A843W5B1_COLES|nr:hypothetical protein [Colocasia esculenta]